MSLKRAADGFAITADMSEDPDLKRLANNLHDLADELANSFDSLEKKLRAIESKLNTIESIAGRAR